ncbi:hypothetical protein SESBI_31508 [Sesbania bispinosa]|nr:hypothetical protein SESBI_31508 [Sesbania bispinosa]
MAVTSGQSCILSTANYGLEEKARGYVDSIHIEDDPVDKYSLPEQQQPHKDLETEIVMKETSALEASKVHETPVQPHQDLETETKVKKTSAPEEEVFPSIPSDAHKIHEAPVDLEKESWDLETSEQEPSTPSDAHKIHETPVDLEKESWEEKPPVKSYASILGSPSGKPSVAQQPSQRSSPIPSDVHHSSQLSSRVVNHLLLSNHLIEAPQFLQMFTTPRSLLLTVD